MHDVSCHALAHCMSHGFFCPHESIDTVPHADASVMLCADGPMCDVHRWRGKPEAQGQAHAVAAATSGAAAPPTSGGQGAGTATDTSGASTAVSLGHCRRAVVTPTAWHSSTSAYGMATSTAQHSDTHGRC